MESLAVSQFLLLLRSQMICQAVQANQDAAVAREVRQRGQADASA